ncbi:phosphohistidine phosphatase SixA [Pseudomonas tohonis]|uniref:phosphohistidine phosphatase SixA n=1 Tax=Pseudomonas tohonis TaxID=2725477 RepID=UPI001F19853B|nr:phosphohistidine phosphatase SixA [Pseudomonas tohonis]
MRLWLLRHGEAEPRAATDAERPLTRNGRQEVLHAAARLAGRPLQAIIASPYLRAQQSAELVREALDFSGALVTQPWLTPESDPREALARLAEREEGELLLVTHNPFIGELAGLLIHGHRQQPLPLGTASLVELEGDMALAGLMELRSLHHAHRI